MGLSNGSRELMILIPEADPGRFWQLRGETVNKESFQLGHNLFQYVGGGMTLGVRPEPYYMEADPKITPKRQLRVVRLLAGDNADPEPGGWRRMAALLHNTANIHLSVDAIPLGKGKLAGAKIAHLTGTTRFKLTAEQQKELSEFINDGGTLIVDAAGGSAEFADSAEAALIAVFGGKPGEFGKILPQNHPLYTMKGFTIDKFAYRRYCRGRIAGQLTAPRVRAIEENGRITVFYSREDLSTGIVGQDVEGVIGYAPATATSIMRNILVYVGFGG
jgi:hypothetical protein